LAIKRLKTAFVDINLNKVYTENSELNNNKSISKPNLFRYG